MTRMADYAKLPSFQFYPGDWFKDPALRAVSLAARGLWIDMLCLMHESPRRGYLQHASGKPVTRQQLARMTGCSMEELAQLLEELADAGVYSTTEEGIIFSRRMVRDEEFRQIRQEAGRKGGITRSASEAASPEEAPVEANGKQTPSTEASKSQANGKQTIKQKPSKASSKTQANGQANTQAKRGSSSSSSISSSSSFSYAPSFSSSSSSSSSLGELSGSVKPSGSGELLEVGAEPKFNSLPRAEKQAAEEENQDLPVEVAGLVFPCVGPTKEWQIPAEFFRNLETCYPGIDLVAELRKALAWILANPGRRKTARGMPRFLTSWLNRYVDSRNRAPPPSRPAVPPFQEKNLQATAAWLEAIQQEKGGHNGKNL